ncbi:hypothetical protein BC567DRAFT_231554 [Phyllosticta citribraziliensis]
MAKYMYMYLTPFTTTEPAASTQPANQPALGLSKPPTEPSAYPILPRRLPLQTHAGKWAQQQCDDRTPRKLKCRNGSSWVPKG